MRRWLPPAALAGLVGSIAYYRLRHVNPFRPRLERIELSLPPGAEELDGLRIGFVTDTHVGPFTSASDIRRGLALFDSEPLELLLLGGDYVSESNLYASAMANAFAEAGRDGEAGSLRGYGQS